MGMDRLFLSPQDIRNQPFEDFVNFYFRKGGLMVDIGCGEKKIHPSFVGVDPYVETSDLKAYMWDTPFINECVDLLVCMSALEHVSKYWVVPTLKEFARILRPNGAFAILVPNFWYCMLQFMKNPSIDWEMDLIFGHQVGEGELHRTAFTVDIIQRYFAEVPNLQILNIYDINAYSQLNLGIIGKKISTI